MKNKQLVIKTVALMSAVILTSSNVSSSIAFATETLNKPTVAADTTSTDIALGTIGSSSWHIDTNGVLYIGGGDFGGTSPGGRGLSPWNSYKDNITSIVLEGKVTNVGGGYNNLFSGLSNVVSIEGINYLDTTGVTRLNGLFASMSSLQGTLDLSSFNTSSVTDMNGLFLSDSQLTGVNVSSFDTSNVTDMGGMFSGMSSLQTLDLSSFNTSSLTWNAYFLAGTTALSQLTVGSNFSFGDSAMLPEITPNAIYTGAWQNIGSGSVDAPAGNKIWTSNAFMSNYNGATDADTYVWQKNPVQAADVTINYVDEDGHPIPNVSSQIISGNIGENYDATTSEYKLDIAGYTLDESRLPSNATGKFTNQPQTVTYVYEKYQDKTSLIVHDSELTVGDTWKAEDNFDSATDYYGNPVPFTDISVSGDVDTDKVGTYKVTYRRFVPNFFSASENQGTYSAIATIKVNAPAPTQGGDVTVKYEDTDGNTISGEVVKTGNVGENYTTEQKDIEGYTFKKVKGDSAGVFTDQPQTVTYVYIKNVEPVSGADVTAKYVDTEGNKISDEVVMSGNIGENYSTEQKTISGYTFKEVEGSATGVFTDQPQTVTYVYTKNPVKIATVIVKYVDTDGNKISEDVVKTGNIGENYSTEQKDIEGYTFKEVKGTATGIYTGEAQVVTYVYTKDKVDTTGISKVDNAPTSESNIKNSKTVSTDKHVLPETSDNGRITLLTVIIGFILLSVGVTITMIRRSKIYK